MNLGPIKMRLRLHHTLLYIEPMRSPKESAMAEFEWLKVLFKQHTEGGYLDSNGRFSLNQRCLEIHECSCGVWSSSGDYRFPNHMVTNSLCLHYLQYHREEIPA